MWMQSACEGVLGRIFSANDAQPVMLQWLCVASLLVQPLGTVRLHAADPETLFSSSVTSFVPDAIFDFRAVRCRNEKEVQGVQG